MSGHEMLELAPLYALDALEGLEEREYEGHLEGCAECRASVDGHRAAAASLVHDQPAAADTWKRISAAIAGENARVVAMTRHRADVIWRWVAGVVAVVAVVLGTVVVFETVQGDQIDSQTITAAADRVAGEPGSFVGEFLVDDVAVAEVVLSDDGRGFVIPTEQLNGLGPDRTYQLWVVNDREDVISAGVLGSSPAPATFTWTGGVTAFALTREVAGGVVSSAGDVVSVLQARS